MSIADCLEDIWENDIVVIPREDGLTVDFDNYWSHEVEVVGNHFDNPEPMEVER